MHFFSVQSIIEFDKEPFYIRRRLDLFFSFLANGFSLPKWIPTHKMKSCDWQRNTLYFNDIVFMFLGQILSVQTNVLCKHGTILRSSRVQFQRPIDIKQTLSLNHTFGNNKFSTLRLDYCWTWVYAFHAKLVELFKMLIDPFTVNNSCE